MRPSLIPTGDPFLDQYSGERSESCSVRVSDARREALRGDYTGREKDYMCQNRPILIQGCTETWRATKDWVHAKGQIHIEQLRKECPDVAVCVTDTTRERIGQGSSCEMQLHTYFDWWQHRKGTELNYLKDWHCAQMLKHHPFYSVPEYFQDDWLSPFYEQQALRAPGDVLRSYSWSVNISGSKTWRLLPPELTFLLYNKTGNQLAPDLTLDGIEGYQRSDFLNLELARELALTVHQGPGECLFVPSGWHHVVHNTTDVLSINENWIHAFNLHWTWELLKQTYHHAAYQLSDCREGCTESEFEILIQRLIQAECGMSYLDWIEFLHFAYSHSLQGTHSIIQSHSIHHVVNEIANFIESKKAEGVSESEMGHWNWVQAFHRLLHLDKGSVLPPCIMHV